jgi:hypothetical protein
MYEQTKGHKNITHLGRRPQQKIGSYRKAFNTQASIAVHIKFLN